MVDTETLAQLLHEAGRGAVRTGKTVAHSIQGQSDRTFIEWEDLNEDAREGRRIQARFLLERLVIVQKKALEQRHELILIPDETTDGLIQYQLISLRDRLIGNLEFLLRALALKTSVSSIWTEQNQMIQEGLEAIADLYGDSHDPDSK